MSGNPFRRAPQRRSPPDPTQSEPQPRPRTPPDDRSRPKKKKVVIQTPPHSPEEPAHEPPRRLSDGKTGSPPPPLRALALEDDSDSTATADSDLDTANINARRNSGPLQPPPTSFHAQSGSKAPYNPFERTLATSEASYGRRGDGEENGDVDEPLVQRGNGRPALDVDAFKNILLTGTATPPSNGQEKPAPPVFRPTFSTTAYQESPRDSIDGPYSDDSDEDNDEHSSLMGPVDSRPQELAPQPPPKPDPGPQTVSFADFEDFTQSPTPVISPETRPTISRNTSDLNKPLPVPPQTLSQPASTSPDLNADMDTRSKKAPPPPPTARRPGHHTPSTGRPRSSSNQTTNSVVEEAKEIQSKPSKASAAAPPPPPSRRAQPVQALSTEPQPQHPRPPSQSQSQVESAPTAVPPPPPRRNPSKTGSASIGRTSSTSSRTSITKDTNAAGNAAAPPPPPPRRAPGGSKRFSSTSQQILEDEESTTSSRPPERDFLSDLDAFQAEIDALRAQAAKDT